MSAESLAVRQISMTAIIVIDLTDIRTHQEGAIWVSYCPALDFHTQGATEAEAIAACQAGVRMLLDLADRGFPLLIPGGYVPAEASA